MRLLPFEEVSRRLRVAARSYRGVQVYQLRRDLRAQDASVDFAAAALAVSTSVIGASGTIYATAGHPCRGDTTSNAPSSRRTATYPAAG